MSSSESNFSRRSFLKTSAVAGAAATLASMGTNFAHAAGKERIKVGLVGCGGRGTGAARDAIKASPQVEIVAMGDLFKDRLDASRAQLAKQGEQFKVSDDACFVGQACVLRQDRIDALPGDDDRNRVPRRGPRAVDQRYIAVDDGAGRPARQLVEHHPGSLRSGALSGAWILRPRARRKPSSTLP